MSDTHHETLADSLRSRLLRGVPTVLVLALLVGLAYAGHTTGWTVPKFAELFGDADPEKDDWCDDHGVPKAICVECDDSLLPRIPSTWCDVHGVHNCPFEHPEVAQLIPTPIIDPADLERARRGLALKPRPENSRRCKLHNRRIQVASTDVLDKMEVDYTKAVTRMPIVETISAPGEISFEQPRVAPIFTSVTGRIWLVTDKGVIGSEVKRGDILALVNSADIGKAKAEFLHAFAQLDLRTKTVANLRPGVSQGSIPPARFMEAELAEREAQIRLRAAQQTLVNLGMPIQIDDVKGLSPEELSNKLQFFGIPSDLTRGLDAKTTTANLLPVFSPRDGTVTAANVSLGEMVDAKKTLFVVTDTRKMWLFLHVHSEEVKYLRARDAKTGAPGQAVRFRPDGSDQEVTGELVWISRNVDERTRAVQVRVDLPNPDGKLLASTFGTGAIVIREEKNAIVVPTEALHWDKECHIVFVRDKNFLQPDAPKVFHVRSVRPGVRNGGYTEILAGVLPGEILATTNSAVLRSELLKSSLGVGCGCEH